MDSTIKVRHIIKAEVEDIQVKDMGQAEVILAKDMDLVDIINPAGSALSDCNSTACRGVW